MLTDPLEMRTLGPTASKVVFLVCFKPANRRTPCEDLLVMLGAQADPRTHRLPRRRPLPELRGEVGREPCGLRAQERRLLARRQRAAHQSFASALGQLDPFLRTCALGALPCAGMRPGGTVVLASLGDAVALLRAAIV